VDLTEQVLAQFRQELLERIASTHVHGVVLDVSGVEVMDSTDFEMLRMTMSMASVMGAEPIIVGLKPGIVSALIDMDVDTRGVRAALNLDDALRMLGASEAGSVTSEPDTDLEIDADDD
jgi:rsbT antagonist protein RsbS